MDRKGTLQDPTMHAQERQFNSEEEVEHGLQLAAHMLAALMKTVQANLGFVVHVLDDIKFGKSRNLNK